MSRSGSQRDHSVHFNSMIAPALPPVTMFDIPGTGGNDNLSGTTGDDTFDLTQGGRDYVSGLEGADTFNMGGTLNARDQINGGDGFDTLVLDGDYSVGLMMRAATIVGIEAIQLTAGHSYNLTPHDAAVAQPLSITVDGSTLGAGDVLTFNASKEADGSYTVTGGAAGDVLTAGGGPDALYGGIGNDLLSGRFGSDTLDGGDGIDTVSYAYADPIIVDLWSHDASEQGGSHDAIYNVENVIGSAYGDSLFDDGANNAIYGGKGGDGIFLWHGGNDTGKGGEGNDNFVMDKALNAGDRIDGGKGYDTINLGETATITLAAKTLMSLEEIVLTGGWSYDITTHDKTVGGGATLTLTGTGLQPTDTAHFNGSGETNGHFVLNGGDGADLFIGGAQSDTLFGDHGTDTLTGGGGGDTFKYAEVADSYHTSYDDITDFDAAADNFDLWFAVSGVDGDVACGTLDDLSTAADAAHLAAGHALVATVGSDIFMVIDANAADGYQVGEDLLIRINGAANLNDLAADDFTFTVII